MSPTISVESGCSSNSPTLRNESRKNFADMVSSAVKPNRVVAYLKDEVNGKHTSIYLLVSFFTSGLIDSVAFNAWACFVGMQTGNLLKPVN